MKIRPVGAELFHAGRRTDMTKLTVACHNFRTRLKMRTSGPSNGIAKNKSSLLCYPTLIWTIRWISGPFSRV